MAKKKKMRQKTKLRFTQRFTRLQRKTRILSFVVFFGILGLLFTLFTNARSNRVPKENQVIFMYEHGHGHTMFEADFEAVDYPIILYGDGLLVCGRETDKETVTPVVTQAKLNTTEIRDFVKNVKNRGWGDIKGKHFRNDSGLIDPTELQTSVYLHDRRGAIATHGSGKIPKAMTDIAAFAEEYCKSHAKDEYISETYRVDSVPSVQRAKKVSPGRRALQQATARNAANMSNRPHVLKELRSSDDNTLVQSREVAKATAQSVMRNIKGKKLGQLKFPDQTVDVRFTPLLRTYVLRDVQTKEVARADKGKVYAGAARTVEFVWFYPSDKALQSGASTKLNDTSLAVRSWYRSKVQERIIHGGNRIYKGTKTLAAYETCPPASSNFTCTDKLQAIFYNVQFELATTNAEVVVLFQGTGNGCKGYGGSLTGSGKSNVANSIGSATNGLAVADMNGCYWQDGREVLATHELGHGLGAGHWCNGYNIMYSPSCSTKPQTLGQALLNSTQKTELRNNSTFFTTNTNYLSKGEAMYGDTILQSPNKTYQLRMQQSDGNLVLYQGTTARWNSRTSGYPNSYAIFQTDGNLVVRKTNGTVCHSNTGGKGGYRVYMQDDGNLVIVNSSSTPIWSRMFNTWYC